MSKRLRRPAAISLFLAPLLASLTVLSVSGCGGEGGQTITVTGSTTLLTMTEAAAQLYEKEHPGVRVLVQGGGSSAGVEAVSSGTADIGSASRDLKGEEEKLGLVDHAVAIDAIAIIVNPRNPVDGLGKSEAASIFRGRIANWKQVGGLDEEIVLVNRDEASGTREAFSKSVLDEKPFDKYAVILPGTGQVRSVVSDASAAIGYISVGFLTDEVKPLALDGVRPTQENVKARRYGVQRTLHYFTKGAAKGLAKDFIDFVLSPKIQKDIVAVEFVPIRD